MTTTKIGKTDHHHFDTRFFMVGGKEYEIVGTESTGRGAGDVVHRVKGATETKEMKHATLVRLYKQGKLISIYKSKN